MSKSSRKQKKPHHEAWKTCRHVESVGQMAVYVDMDCPEGRSVKGRCLCLKDNCDGACLHWEAKE